MAEMPMVAPRNLSDAMRAVVDTHAKIREDIQRSAEEQAALRRANDQRMTAESGLGYRAQT